MRPGRRTIGVVGGDVPRQLVLASGAVPRRILGSWTGEPSREAAELLGTVDVAAARILGGLLDDDSQYAGLIVCNDSAAHLRLFYVLRVLHLRGRFAPPVHLLDTPRGSGPRRKFVVWQYLRLVDFCAGLTGQEPNAVSLREAADAERALGDALGRLRDRRVRGACSGSAALTAYRAAMQQDPAGAISAIDAATRAAAPGPRIVVTGSDHPDASVYDAIAAAGIEVVGEDHGTGESAWLGAYTGRTQLDGAVDELARRHVERPPAAARSLSAERAELLRERVAHTAADGVLALAREFDDAPLWDLSSQRSAIDVPLEARFALGTSDAIAATREALQDLRARMTERNA